jgi:hypothetical protein
MMRRSTWLLFACLFLCTQGAGAEPSKWSLETYWGGSGTGAGELQDPRALAFGPNDHLYVADYANARVQQFDADGNFVRAWGLGGDEEERFGYLKGITVDADGNVYVLDNKRIDKFTAEGAFLQSTARGLIVDGYGLAAAPDNIIYTIGQYSLSSYDQDLMEIGRQDVVGCSEGSYAAITIANQQLYLTDSSCQAIDAYTPAGDRLGHWTVAGLLSPFSIAEHDGELFVTSPTERAIRIVAVDGMDTGDSIAIPKIGSEVLYPSAVTAHKDHIYVLAGDYVMKFARQTAVQNASWTEMKARFQ